MRRILVILLVMLTVVSCFFAIPITASASSSYQLKENTWDGVWVNSYYNYNSYAYALGMTDGVYYPGCFYSGNPYITFTDNDRVKDIKILQGYVKQDLLSLNYHCIKVTENAFSVPQDGVNLICIRNGYANTSNGIARDFDVHFMKYVDGVWCHKPGNTAILHYNSQPNHSTPWRSEYVFYDGEFLDIYQYYITYDGPIYFIAYREECDIKTQYYNTSTHRTFCKYCDSEVIEPHTMIKEPFGRVCSAFCGYMIRNNGEIITPWNNEGIV